MTMTKDEAINLLYQIKFFFDHTRKRGRYTEQLAKALGIAIDNLSAEPKWIPVSERLPKVGQDVLFYDGAWTEEGYLMSDGNWLQFRWSTLRKKEEVTAWMPLPKPYDERRNHD